MTHYRMDDPPPRDGTLIDLWQANGERIANARWNKTRNAWDFMSCHGMFITLQQSDVMGECRVTHWEPIVPPPAEPQEPTPGSQRCSTVKELIAELSKRNPDAAVTFSVELPESEDPTERRFAEDGWQFVAGNGHPRLGEETVVTIGVLCGPSNISDVVAAEPVKRGGPFDHALEEDMKRR